MGLGARVNTSLRWLRLGRMRCAARRKSEENQNLKEGRKTNNINFRLNISVAQVSCLYSKFAV